VHEDTSVEEHRINRGTCQAKEIGFLREKQTPVQHAGSKWAFAIEE